MKITDIIQELNNSIESIRKENGTATQGMFISHTTVTPTEINIYKKVVITLYYKNSLGEIKNIFHINHTDRCSAGEEQLLIDTASLMFIKELFILMNKDSGLYNIIYDADK